MSNPTGHRSKTRVLIAMFFGTIFAALGDISLSKGMKIVGATHFPGAYHEVLAAVTNPYVLLGILFLSVFSTIYLISLSWERLSYVLPLTGAIYVFVTIFAYYYLGEAVSSMRWMGSLLVATGVILVART